MPVMEIRWSRDLVPMAAAWAAGVGVFAFPHEEGVLVLVGYANLPEASVQPAVRALAQAAAVTRE